MSSQPQVKDIISTRARPDEHVMSGINTTIEWMTRQRALTSIAVGYVYAALLVAGPWIFTVIGLVGLSAGSCAAGCDQLPVFRSIVIYNSLFALVVTSPLAFLLSLIHI